MSSKTHAIFVQIYCFAFHVYFAQKIALAKSSPTTIPLNTVQTSTAGVFFITSGENVKLRTHLVCNSSLNCSPAVIQRELQGLCTVGVIIYNIDAGGCFVYLSSIPPAVTLAVWQDTLGYDHQQHLTDLTLSRDPGRGPQVLQLTVDGATEAKAVSTYLHSLLRRDFTIHTLLVDSHSTFFQTLSSLCLMRHKAWIDYTCKTILYLNETTYYSEESKTAAAELWINSSATHILYGPAYFIEGAIKIAYKTVGNLSADGYTGSRMPIIALIPTDRDVNIPYISPHMYMVKPSNTSLEQFLHFTTGSTTIYSGTATGNINCPGVIGEQAHLHKRMNEFLNIEPPSVEVYIHKSPFGPSWKAHAEISPNMTIHKMASTSPVKDDVYYITTMFIDPFVMVSEPADDSQKDNPCWSQGLVCMNVTTSDKHTLRVVFADYNSGKKELLGRVYRVVCCSGYGMDLLRALAADIGFGYNLYIVADHQFGWRDPSNGKWTGIVGDILSGAADFNAGAFSVTKPRSAVIDYTDPYFYSGFSMIAKEQRAQPGVDSIWRPFEPHLWVAITCAVFVVTVAVALFEWFSPFGLNPTGRNRDAHYSLGSAFTMVFSLLFGNTIVAKIPKCQITKMMQLIWSFAGLTFYASYTGYLAAFLADEPRAVYTSIFDPKLFDAKVGGTRGHAAMTLVQEIHPSLYSHLQTYLVADENDGIQKLINGELDVYLGDTPVLEYATINKDRECVTKIVGKAFGSDSYALGFPRTLAGSRIGGLLSKQIRLYRATGYLERLDDKYFSRAQCVQVPQDVESLQLNYIHHSGTFLLLVTGVAVGMVVLVIELLCFSYALPRFRRAPRSSCWKSLCCLFFSQRLYRLIHAGEIQPTHRRLKRMLSYMTNAIRVINKTPAGAKKELRKTQSMPAIRINRSTASANGKLHLPINSPPKYDQCVVNPAYDSHSNTPLPSPKHSSRRSSLGAMNVEISERLTAPVGNNGSAKFPKAKSEGQLTNGGVHQNGKQNGRPPQYSEQQEPRKDDSGLIYKTRKNGSVPSKAVTSRNSFQIRCPRETHDESHSGRRPCTCPLSVIWPKAIRDSFELDADGLHEVLLSSSENESHQQELDKMLVNAASQMPPSDILSMWKLSELEWLASFQARDERIQALREQLQAAGLKSKSEV